MNTNNNEASNNSADNTNKPIETLDLIQNLIKRPKLSKQGYFANKQAYTMSINIILEVTATATERHLSKNNMNLSSHDENYLTHCSEHIRNTNYDNLSAKLEELVKPGATRYLTNAGKIALNMLYDGIKEGYRLYSIAAN